MSTQTVFAETMNLCNFYIKGIKLVKTYFANHTDQN